MSNPPIANKLVTEVEQQRESSMESVEGVFNPRSILHYLFVHTDLHRTGKEEAPLPREEHFIFFSIGSSRPRGARNDTGA